MHHTYTTHGTCSRCIDFDLDKGIVSNVVFTGGCDGNLRAIPLLIDGWEASNVIAKLKGVPCRNKNTSCTDQLARALEEACAQDGTVPSA